MPRCSSRTVTLALVTTDSYVIDALAPGSVPGAGQACEGQGRWLHFGRWEVGGGQTQLQGKALSGKSNLLWRVFTHPIPGCQVPCWNQRVGLSYPRDA